MDCHGDDIYRLSPGIVVLWMLDMPSGPTVVLMLSAVGVSALFRRQNEEHDTAGQALPEFESPTPPKTGGLKTERVIYTVPFAPPVTQKKCASRRILFLSSNLPAIKL